MINRRSCQRQEESRMSEVTWMERDVNPITKLDYPDVDVIRVENTYYMVSTTMHFMPGCEILRSYDLIHWELPRCSMTGM